MSESMNHWPLGGFLIDIDGVLRIGAVAIPGAAESIAWLRRRRIPFRLLTNVTRKSRAEEATRLANMGISVTPDEVYTASVVAAEYLRRQGARRCLVLLEGTAIEDFHGLELSERDPEYVVLGDLGDDFPASRLHDAFRALLAGARLVAIQRNPAWTGDDGLARLDVGAWVAALEFSSGQQAAVMGKPALFAYQLPAAELGLPLEQLGVVADDPDVDLAGARRAGLQTVFVQTTSMPRRRSVADGEFDYTLDSIADLPRLIP
jgi:HAD superfamily hydrolase (TIGR01458 family)